MKLFRIKVHAAIDYLLGIVIILSPALFGFSGAPYPRYTAWAFGAGVLFVLSCTKYGLGLVNIINHRFHMIVDIILGLALATSPWSLGFEKITWLPHLVLGSVVVLSALITEKDALEVDPDKLNKNT